LIIGDSTIRKQYFKLCQKRGKVGEQEENTLVKKVFFVQIFNAGIVPSEYHADEIMNHAIAEGLNPVELEAVYHNFAALHLLPLFPDRPFKSPLPNPNQTKIPADFDGWFNLEQIMLDHFNFFTKSTSISSENNVKFIAMTPHWVCDAKYNGRYRAILENDEHVPSCMQWFSMQKERSEGFRAIVSMLTSAQVKEICSKAILTGEGSYYISERIKKWATETEVPVVDAYNMTYDQCSHTKDARHYDYFIDTEVKQLLDILNQKR